MGTATIYVRQSLDRHSDELAVGRQLQLCREFCAEQGWDIAAEFIDNDRSATSGRDRPEFERLLTSHPERIVVWHTDRLIRLTRDLERVIALGVNVHAIHTGHLDLSNPAGRAVARTVTAWAQYEGEQKALRQRASNDQRAALGRPPAGGRRLYGYSPDGMTTVEAEAQLVREAVSRLLDGLPLRTVVRWLNDAGGRTTAGNPWKATEFRRYLRNPRLIAQRSHRGEVVGPGLWPALLDEDDHVAVNALLSDPSRRPSGRPRTYLLSGVARCGACEGRIYGRVERRGAIYVCEDGAHLGRKVAPIDDYVSGVVVARLARPDTREAFSEADRTDEAAALRDERAGVVTRLDGLAEAFAAGDIDRRQLAAGTKRLRARLEHIDATLPELLATPAMRDVVTASDVAAAWQALPTETQREIVGTLAAVTIHRAGRGARIFDPDTVSIAWRTAP